MAKKETDKEKGRGILAALNDAVDSVKTTVQNVKLPEIKAPEIKVPEPVKDIFKKKPRKDEPDAAAEDTAQTEEPHGKKAETKAAGQVKDIFKKKPRKDEPDDAAAPVIKAISTKNAIKVIYYLMAADGEIFHREEEKFDAIGTELDPNFAKNKDRIVKECKTQMEKVIDPEDYYDVLQDGVELSLSPFVQTEDASVAPKLLVWDLLTVAYSDESYDDAERKLLKYVVRKLNIDRGVFLEMESSLLTLIDLERELNWIKTTDRPYLTIESMVNELADRKTVIFESVKDLITL